MDTWILDPVEWLAFLRIGVGLWWLESVRHKNLDAWFKRGEGIGYGASVAAKHRWAFVRNGFDKTVKGREQTMAYLVVGGEAAIGLGLVFGFLTPIALVAALVLNLLYFVLMIHDWGEQGQNSMMFLIELVCLGTHAWYEWSIDSSLGLFGA
jgi:thiosulfate dehydrogenase [quinone] large subunit